MGNRPLMSGLPFIYCTDLVQSVMGKDGKFLSECF